MHFGVHMSDIHHRTMHQMDANDTSFSLLESCHQVGLLCCSVMTLASRSAVVKSSAHNVNDSRAFYGNVRRQGSSIVAVLMSHTSAHLSCACLQDQVTR